jgi:hypothetical protein
MYASGVMMKAEQAAYRADEIVPVDVSHEAKTVEIPAFPIPHIARRDEITIPVQWSLESLLEHELLRRQSAARDE